MVGSLLQAARTASRDQALARLLGGGALAKVAITAIALNFLDRMRRQWKVRILSAVLYINASLLFDTFTVLVLLLLARGWRVTRRRLSEHDWRLVFGLACWFYIAEAMLVVFRGDVSPLIFFLLAVLLRFSILYSVMSSINSNIRQLFERFHQSRRSRSAVLTNMVAFRLLQYMVVLCLLSMFFLRHGGTERFLRCFRRYWRDCGHYPRLYWISF